MKENPPPYGFVYLWMDVAVRRFYIGSHYGTTSDGYIASSKWLKAAHRKRPQDFKRRILQYLTIDDKKLLLQMEQSWLNLIKPRELSTSKNVMAGTNRYYNMKAHAAGGNGSANKGKGCGKIHNMYGSVNSNAYSWKVTKPCGEEIVVHNLDQFCQSLGISKPALYGAFKEGGLRTVGKLKGWKLELINSIPMRNRVGPSCCSVDPIQHLEG